MFGGSSDETFKSHFFARGPMKVVYKETKKGRLLFSVEGANHAVAGALKDQLWEDKATTAAGYSVAHPLVGIPEFVLETSGKDAKKVLTDAVAGVKKKLDKLGKEAKALKL